MVKQPGNFIISLIPGRYNQLLEAKHTEKTC